MNARRKHVAAVGTAAVRQAKVGTAAGTTAAVDPPTVGPAKIDRSIAALLAILLCAGMWGCDGSSDEIAGLFPCDAPYDGPLDFPRWDVDQTAHECPVSPSEAPDEPEGEPVLAEEWVRGVDGVVYGEIVEIEPVLDLLYRSDTRVFDTEGACLNPAWRTAFAMDVVVAPTFAVGLAEGEERVRIRLSQSTMSNWEGDYSWCDGRLVSDRSNQGLAPGMMLGARLWDLGVADWAEGEQDWAPDPEMGRIYTPLSHSLFTFDEDDLLRFQYPSSLPSYWYCVSGGERHFHRDVDDIRYGLPRADFEALLAALPAEAFGRENAVGGNGNRTGPRPFERQALSPEGRAVNQSAAGHFMLLISSHCRVPQ